MKQDPSYVPVRQLLLRQLLEMRKIEEAMTVLQEGLEHQPAQTGWAMSLARLQLEQHDLAAADRTLARSQVYAEASADYAGFQGHLKSRQSANRAAVTHYQRATRLAPNEGRWWLGLGLAQGRRSRCAAPSPPVPCRSNCPLWPSSICADQFVSLRSRSCCIHPFSLLKTKNHEPPR